MRPRRDATARVMCDALVDQLPGYGALSASEQRLLFGDVHQTLSLALDRSATGDPNTAGDLDLFRDQGDRRGSTSFPFTDLLEGGHILAVTALRSFWEVATAHNYRELAGIQAWSAREVPRVMEAVVAGYISASAHNGHPAPGRELLIQHLLHAKPATSLAHAAGITLPPSYMVLLCSVARPSEVSAAQRDRIGACLRAIPGALYQPNLHRLLILLPALDGPYLARRIAADLVTCIAQLTGRAIQAAQAYRPDLAGIPDAVAEAEEVLTLIAAIPDAVSRPYIIDELLVELAIAYRPDIITRLASQLAPLDAGTDLRTTLEVLYACDLDREHTAKTLHIHRRTLTYRIGRIQKACGIDPTTAHGIALLRAALTATRMTTP